MPVEERVAAAAVGWRPLIEGADRAVVQGIVLAIATIASTHPHAASTVGSRDAHSVGPSRCKLSPCTQIGRGGFFRYGTPGWVIRLQRCPVRHPWSPSAL